MYAFYQKLGLFTYTYHTIMAIKCIENAVNCHLKLILELILICLSAPYLTSFCLLVSLHRNWYYLILVRSDTRGQQLL